MSTDEQQKRGGFVPVGQVAARLPGIEGRGPAMSANSRNHFTVLKQIDHWRCTCATWPPEGATRCEAERCTRLRARDDELATRGDPA